MDEFLLSVVGARMPVWLEGTAPERRREAFSGKWDSALRFRASSSDAVGAGFEPGIASFSSLAAGDNFAAANDRPLVDDDSVAAALYRSTIAENRSVTATSRVPTANFGAGAAWNGVPAAGRGFLPWRHFVNHYFNRLLEHFHQTVAASARGWNASLRARFRGAPCNDPPKRARSGALHLSRALRRGYVSS